MLDAVLDPFHRAAGDFRRQRHQHDKGKHRKLYAETAAGVRRDAQPQFRSRHAQRARHHRMHRKRPLEIRRDVVAVFGRVMRRDHDIAFDRREREAMERHRHGDAAIGAGEGALRVAIREVAHRDFVGLGFGMQERRVVLAGRDRIDHRRERFIVDLHQLGRVLGDIAVLGDDQRHRLADIAHTLDGERPLPHRRLDRSEERIGQLADLLAGDARPRRRHAPARAPRRCGRSRRAHAASG